MDRVSGIPNQPYKVPARRLPTHTLRDGGSSVLGITFLFSAVMNHPYIASGSVLALSLLYLISKLPSALAYARSTDAQVDPSLNTIFFDNNSLSKLGLNEKALRQGLVDAGFADGITVGNKYLHRELMPGVNIGRTTIRGISSQDQAKIDRVLGVKSSPIEKDGFMIFWVTPQRNPKVQDPAQFGYSPVRIKINN